MLGWMTYWVWWFTWRAVLTVACMYTVQHVIHQEGYFIEWQTLMVATLCAIIGLRVWMPNCKRENNVDH